MNRFAHMSAAVLFASVLVLSGCQPKVEVETGERIDCRYGHTVSSEVTTKRVPAKDASKYQVETRVIICERHARVRLLYEAAQKALAKGDIKTAKAKLDAVLAADPSFGKARSQLEQIALGKKPAPDTTTGSSGDTSSNSTSGSSSGGGSSAKPKPSPKPVGPVLSLSRWVPEQLSGFTTGVTSADALVLAREYSPTSDKGPEALVISAEQFASKQAATSALAEQRARFPKDADTVEVAGRKSSLGTDGREFAMLAFTQGEVLVVLEAHARPASSPDRLFGDLKDVAGNLPASK